MSCCNNRKKKYKDRSHVSILAKQFAAVEKAEVALVKHGDYYEFYTLSHAIKKKYEVLQIFGVPASKEVLQDGGDAELSIPVEGCADTGRGESQVIRADDIEAIRDMGGDNRAILTPDERKAAFGEVDENGEAWETSC